MPKLRLTQRGVACRGHFEDICTFFNQRTMIENEEKCSKCKTKPFGFLLYLIMIYDQKLNI